MNFPSSGKQVINNKKKMPNKSPCENWLLRGFSAEEEKIIQDDISHENNIYHTRGISRMPASALGCLCVMQVYGRYLNPIEKERKAETERFLPLSQMALRLPEQSIPLPKKHEGTRCSRILARVFRF